MPLNRARMLTVAKGRPMNIKTQLCREYEKDLTSRLLEYKNEFTEFRKNFNPKEHYIEAVYTVFTPAELLFKKEGGISLRASDNDSYKVFTDCLFDSIGLDDKYIRDQRIISAVSDDENWNYIISLEVKKLELLCQRKYGLMQNIIEPQRSTLM